MLGIISWMVCGLAAGFIVNHLISGADKGIVLLTLGVGIGGAILGGYVASLFSYGNSATFNFYALVFATVGASATLFGYQRMIDT
jgi:uncharacterized membrane protein YeaQ/YmgE (transglycosylase-associated protein family)